METLIAIFIVGLAIFYVGRRFFINLRKGSQASCGCECSACDVNILCEDPGKTKVSPILDAMPE